MRRISSLLTISSAFIATFAVSPATVLADAWDKDALSSTFSGLSTSTIDEIIKNFALWILYIVGFVSIISFAISGIQYFLAGANEEMAERAKKTMLWSIIGTIVAISGLVFIYAADAFLNAGGTGGTI